MSFTIETLTHADVDQIRQLATLHASVVVQWRPGFIASEAKIAEAAVSIAHDITRPEARIVVARCSEQTVAGLHWLVLHGTDDVYVNTLWVQAAQRGRGIGTALKDAGETWARSKGAQAITTTVAIANPSMIAFNERRGFAVESVDMTKSL